MPPALPPAPLGAAMFRDMAGRNPPAILIECFFDLVCPFSRKIFLTLNGALRERYADRGVQVLLHQTIQPWHPTSAMVHEAALAVQQINPDAFYPFCNQIYLNFEEFLDDKTADLSRHQIYQKLAELAKVPPINMDEKAVMDKLRITKPGNGGNAVTQAVKWVTRHHRVRGVHVTPTVFINGQEAGQVSSGWNIDQWAELIDGLLEVEPEKC